METRRQMKNIQYEHEGVAKFHSVSQAAGQKATWSYHPSGDVSVSLEASLPRSSALRQRFVAEIQLTYKTVFLILHKKESCYQYRRIQGPYRFWIFLNFIAKNNYSSRPL
ncbi:MAG: hypothetical protein ABFD82_07365 [Syntrophaceae bacterium]